MATPTRSNKFGGSGGASFDDSPPDVNALGRIRQLVIRHGKLVDSIGVVYADGTYIYHGGSGGSEARIVLAPDEFITKVTGRSGSRLDQIGFTSNMGKTYGPYGGGGGGPFQADFSGKALLYFFGRSGATVDQIGLAYGDVPPVYPSDIVRSNAHGGTGGTPFDDLEASGNLLGKISSITVRHGTRVDSIAIQYKDGPEYLHGGGGGDESVFRLTDDEWVTAIKGRSGRFLDQVQFFLSSGRQSPLYGGTGGEPFEEKMANHVVKAFFGRSSAAVDQLGVYFDTAKPIRVEINSITYDINQLKTLTMPPLTMQSVLLENSTSADQQVRQSVQVTVTETRAITISAYSGKSIAVTVNASVKKPLVEIGGSVTPTLTAGDTFTTESSRAFSRADTFEFSATVPAKSSIKGTCIVKQDEFDIPWTAKAVVSYQGREPEPKTLQGKLRGVRVGRMEARYEPA